MEAVTLFFSCTSRISGSFKAGRMSSGMAHSSVGVRHGAICFDLRVHRENVKGKSCRWRVRYVEKLRSIHQKIIIPARQDLLPPSILCP